MVLDTRTENTPPVLAEGAALAAKLYDLLDVEHRSKALVFMGELLDEQFYEETEALGPYGNGD